MALTCPWSVNYKAIPHNSRLTAQAPLRRLRHGICVAKMLDNVGLRYPHRASGQKPLALCDRCPCFGSLHPPLAALTFAASSIICAFGLASAAPRSPYRHLELCGIAIKQSKRHVPHGENTISRMRHMPVSILPSNKSVHPHWLRRTAPGRCFGHCADHHRPDQRNVR